MYDIKGGIIESTDSGRVSSFYYLAYNTMEEYNNCLSSNLINDIEIFKIFSLSSEFKYISIREGEKSELSILLDKVPIPIKENINNSCSKINVLLQSYISRLKLNGLCINV